MVNDKFKLSACPVPTDGFSAADEVRIAALSLEAPEGASVPTQRCAHLVTDHQRPQRVHVAAARGGQRVTEMGNGKVELGNSTVEVSSEAIEKCNGAIEGGKRDGR